MDKKVLFSFSRWGNSHLYFIKLYFQQLCPAWLVKKKSLIFYFIIEFVFEWQQQASVVGDHFQHVII